MVSGTTTRSEPRLSDLAAHLAFPRGVIRGGYWNAVEQTCRTKLGMTFDPWQCGAGKLVLATDADGWLVHTVGGVGMSLPRQVGKTYLFMGIVFALCMLKPGLLVVWTSHHGKTTAETFLTMQAFANSYKVQPYIKDIYRGSGDEAIVFHNESRILFGAREHGFGRGIPGVDILMCDEAQILSELALQNMLATLNTSRFGLHCYVGTPPKPEDVRAGKAEVFTRMRNEALEGEKNGDTAELVWVEFSADAHADPNDRRQWAKANPSFPHRTPVASMLRMKKRLSADGFRREGLGIWDDDGTVFNLRAWANPPILNREAPQPDRVCLSVAVSTDQKFTTIAVAGRISDEQSLVMYTYDAGMNWAVPMIVDLWNHRRIDEISLSGAAARVFEPELVLAGIEFKKVNAAEMGAACVAFQKDVKNGKVCHLGQPELDLAVANARIRMVGETQQWDRRDPRVDDSPLVGCSGALYRLGVNDSPMPMIVGYRRPPGR